MKRLILFHFLILVVSIGYGQNDTIEKIFYHEDGSVSSKGEMIDGKPIGYWKTYYNNGILKTEGNRENFELTGTWKFYTQNGNLVKEINYQEGKKNGVTKIYNDSAKLIKEEMYVDDIINGKVKGFYPEDEKIKTIISYKNGLKEGVAYELANDDGRIITMTTYDHDFIKKQEKINRKNNLGKQGVWREFYPADSSLKREIRYKNDIYHGYYKEYDRDGKLILALLYIDGILQENPEELTSLELRKTYYENGEVESESTYNYLGEKEGTFKYFNKKGEIEEVKLYSKGILLGKGKLNKKGERIDYWEFYYENEKIRAKGEFKEGLKMGTWTYYHFNGKLEQKGKYVKGEKPHGDWIWYYPNGEVWREESFWKGKEDGLAIEYSDTNTIISKGVYIDGKKDGLWFYELGDHREEGNYVDGLKDGEWVYYYPNKKINFKGSYINGDPNGKHVYFYLNGKIKREEYYELGLEEGTWRSYDEVGNLTLTSEWEGGKEVRLDKKKVK